MPSKSKSPNRQSPLLSPSAWAGTAVLSLLTGIWCAAVNSVVTDPYLDEVFHVAQAKQYLSGNYYDWNPKITTPPGLYLLSLVLSWVTGLSSTKSLRAINAILLPSLVWLLLDMEIRLKSLAKDQSALNNNRRWDLPSHSFHQLHVAFNIALFPPLFFFSALYYTDIASLVSVLICWNHFLRSHDHAHPTWRRDFWTVLYGLASLTFRQTNIFFVAIFPAAVLLVSRIDIGFDNTEDEETLLDPPVREARIDDYLFFAMSLVHRIYRAVRLSITGGYKPWKLIRLFVPQAIILVLFAAFVVVNGGVVLGDKSNHVATIHISQMLYLWPYILFFSWPLCYPYLVQIIFSFVTMTPILGQLEAALMFKRRKVFPRFTAFIGAVLVSSLIIHYNTIIHPFTLADNRHYMFYIFRRLTSHRAIRYLAAPIYCAGSWAVIQTLGAPVSIQISADEATHTAIAIAQPTSPVDTPGPPPDRPLRINLAVAQEGAPVSYVAIWLATSALHLVSAPLVEPRYFILPWIMWRLRVPRSGRDEYAGTPRMGEKPWRAWWVEHDYRLWIETAWFLLVNAVTGYVFLYRGFEWAQEAGKVQRFMW